MKDNHATLFGNSTAVDDWRMECLGRYMNNRYSRSGNRQTWEYINSTHVATSLQRCDSEVYNLRLVYHAFILTLSFYSLSLRWKFSSESVRADCRVCYKLVTPRQHAFECDNCRRWVHRLCGTGISYNQYRDIMDRLRHGGNFEWLCPTCGKESGRRDQRRRRAARGGTADARKHPTLVCIPSLSALKFCYIHNIRYVPCFTPVCPLPLAEI